MKKVICLAMWFGFAACYAAEQDPIQQAVFATDSRPVRAQLLREALGLLNEAGNVWGLAYSREISERLHLWANAALGEEQIIFLDHFSETRTQVVSRSKETRRVQLSAGVEQVFHLSSNRNWGILLGAGMGWRKSEYWARSHPKFCTSYCGFRMGEFTDITHTDSFFFAKGRLGVAAMDTVVAGVTGDVKLIFSPTLMRQGQPALPLPDGDKIKFQDLSFLSIETLVRF